MPCRWGEFDVIDACDIATGMLSRTFYNSTNGTCIDRTGHVSIPLNECVGPFGKPRPWGTFECKVGGSRRSVGGAHSCAAPRHRTAAHTAGRRLCCLHRVVV